MMALWANHNRYRPEKPTAVKHVFLSWIPALVACSLLLFACAGEASYPPKPRGYHRIDLPKAAYRPLPDSLPYSFEYSTHAKLLRDSSVMAERYWMEIYYPSFTANIDISYKLVRSQADFRDYVADCYKLAQKHNIKAQAIDEIVAKTPQGYTSVVYQLEGDVPSTFQFYVTDSVRHFLRASLYFPSAELNDSLAPVISYLKQDMVHMMNTVDWKTKFRGK
jgi:gliding motility-associated lipoprotein GldD